MNGHTTRAAARRPPERRAPTVQQLDAHVVLGEARLFTRWWQVSRPTRWSAHRHREHELVWDVSGSVAIEVADRLWLVPPGTGLWIPAGTTHDVAVHAPSSFACTFVEPDSFAMPWDAPCLIAINPLAAEALRQNSVADVSDPLRDQIVDVAVGMLSRADDTLTIPMPSDPRARIVADALLAEPVDNRSVEAWALQAHTSPRTLRRLFVKETGLSVVQWRALLRLREAVSLLGDGLTVAEVSARVGYQSPSAFSAAFRRTMGGPPGHFAATRGGLSVASSRHSDVRP
ncbi:helix-turn-helix domain-containing protein [Tessaracoccus caeni]|uniref:helix-turn-helix domain-containing protein n=1 Tax=Tessaracoccus caeni TaxID=3031239 RepID=UPI0023DC2AF3|nr:helix-turn-helix transcriptional regulator [Tessaracoccus caeni]MDF1488719.1 helix-turn-helix transcriptional regulator [Tessaracoccus caeni]